jgi:hypothetical protein
MLECLSGLQYINANGNCKDLKPLIVKYEKNVRGPLRLSI